MKKDVRPQLEAIAQGKPVPGSPAPAIDEALVKRHQGDFQAWRAFATPAPGEPLAAPADLLSPLP